MSWIDRFQGMHWNPPGNLGWLFLLLIPAAIFYAFYVYRRTEAPLTPGFRTVLSTLRGLLLLLLLAIIARPVISLAIPGGADRGVLILFDRSQSLELPGVETTRFEELMAAKLALQEEVGTQVPVTWVPFGHDIDEPLDTFDQPFELDPKGTSIAGALESGLSVWGGGQRPGAIILVSDGAQTQGADPVPIARRLAIPVSTVPLGSTRAVDDLSLVRVRSNREAFRGERTPVEVVLRQQGLESGNVNVKLFDVTDGQQVLLEEKAIAMEPSGAERKVTLGFKPTEPGLRFLEIVVEGKTGEATSLNNRRMIAMDVREDKTKVLLLSGRLTWDHTFLRRALEADSTLAIHSGYWRSGRFQALNSGLPLPAFNAEALREFRAIVLDHVQPRQLNDQATRAITEFVRAGGGLCFLAGGMPHASWENNPLAELLPVQVGRTGRMREVEARLGPASRRHVLFDPSVPGSAPLEAWTNLPPLSTASGFGALRSTGEALIVAKDAPNGTPLVSWSTTGAGRVLLLAAGGFWNWEFLSSAHRTSHGTMPAWWRRAVHWIAKPDVDTRLDIHPEDFVSGLGDPIRFVARVTDQSYQPLPGVSVDVAVNSIQGDSTSTYSLSLGGEQGFLSGAFEQLPPGRYRYEATASTDSQNLGTVDGVFAVDSLGAEMERLEANHELLSRIARATGGVHWNPDSLGTAFEALERISQGEEETEQVDLWDHPLTFALFVLLGSAEWLLRRRRGLI
ncbi:MAG: hypothetical protein HKN21_14850 [Candidatus Eisenbacteria bacterium]|uniref:Glutamine amidotransferase domain-containing protein n=1 Tax=Eiseniibacteriota bacterium TaxID=2212470 RepID=A0A7Y2EDL3_UNCEI|nr:hypothetical protein [Candidatus Eisenbacteria bacterium]